MAANRPAVPKPSGRVINASPRPQRRWTIDAGLRAPRVVMLGALAALALLVPQSGVAQVPVAAPARDSATAARLIEEARRAAHDDQNRAAADRFAAAIAADASRLPELRIEYAEQLTYSDRARQAVALFRDALDQARTRNDAAAIRRAHLGLALALSWSGELRPAQAEYAALLAADSTDRDARLGLARVLAWRDRLEPAAREYEWLLARDAADFEARRELARVTNWMGRHREALRMIATLAASHPHDAETELIAADAYDWTGRPWMALAIVDSVLARAPGQVNAQRKRASLLRALAPASAVGAEHSWQSDDLHIDAARATHRAELGTGRASLELNVASERYHPASAGTLDPDLTVTRPGLALRLRESAGAELHANAVVGHVQAAGGAPRSVLLPDGYLTLWPNDVVRIDLGAGRSLLDNVRSLADGVTSSVGTASVDWKPVRALQLSVRGRAGRLSDANDFRQGQLEGIYRLPLPATLLVGARVTALGYARVSDEGYFSPTRFVTAQALAHTYGSIARLAYDVDGSYGMEYAQPYGDKPAGSLSVRLGGPRDARLQAELVARTFSSRLSASSGFSRTTLGGTLRYVW